MPRIQCHKCGKTHGTLAGHRWHLKNHHGERPDADQVSEFKMNKKKIQSPMKLTEFERQYVRPSDKGKAYYRCIPCNKDIPKRSVQDHMRNKHDVQPSETLNWITRVDGVRIRNGSKMGTSLEEWFEEDDEEGIADATHHAADDDWQYGGWYGDWSWAGGGERWSTYSDPVRLWHFNKEMEASRDARGWRNEAVDDWASQRSADKASSADNVWNAETCSQKLRIKQHIKEWQPPDEQHLRMN